VEVSTADYIRELRKRWESPDYQAHVADVEQQEQQDRAHREDAWYTRQLERLSEHHVKAVRRGCTPDLVPLTTTEIQRMALGKWTTPEGDTPPGWDGVKSIFLLGKTEVGKTYLATWMAMRQAKRGLDCASTTAARVSTLSFESLLVVRKVDVLILDQLHTLRSPSGRDAPAWQVSPVVDLIDYRYEHDLTTIGAGTIDPENMVDLLGADVRRRFPMRIASDSTEIRRER
jgi:DNA replication protein DnaC